ncbi:sigma-70 family RNA polymerase sigma factor [Aneurinibacillus tyrosinisolvens]|uniref:sigma-70 family RNA polymerase sigma factor n=1 Tax=Aneurinibacillus tyrosinisolvens TaxID=1443435 RepID=UPI00063F2F47|nr:sigma-70 family RNA polymerase sigma factor [Aneurinibacillus tyrosinisolvens]
MGNRQKENSAKQLMNHPIIYAFLQNSDNETLFKKARLSPTKQNIASLDAAFKVFYSEIRFIKYISTLIHSYSVSYDKQQRRNKKSQLALYTLSAGERETQSFLSERENCLEDALSDPFLYKGLFHLTGREKEILELSYMKSMSDTAIANKQGVSQQAVSKARKRALRKLREQIEKQGGK